MSGAAVGGKMIASILILKENGEVLFEFRAASIHTIMSYYRILLNPTKIIEREIPLTY